MKLLLITQVVDKNDSNLGFFHRWIEEFAKHCQEITVICLRRGESSLPNNVTVLSLGKESGTSRFTRVMLFLKYIVQERNKYDGVFVHMNPEYVMLGGFLWKLWRKRVVLWYLHKSVTIKLRIATLLVDRVATASKESFRLKTRKLALVGHGIDTSLFHPEQRKKAGETIRIVTIGRITASKHVLEMLEVLNSLFLRGRKFKFDIIGEPYTRKDLAYADVLQRAIAQRPFAQDITFRGGIPYLMLPSVLAVQDVCINLSATGSIDKAVLDALAAGVPAVTSNEAFKDDTIARYCPLNPEALANVVEELFDSPPDPQALSLAVAKRYGLSACIERILSLYTA